VNSLKAGGRSEISKAASGSGGFTSNGVMSNGVVALSAGNINVPSLKILR
jgi:hypothetical protein